MLRCSGNAEKSTLFRDSVAVLRTSAVFNAVLLSGAWFCVSLVRVVLAL